MNHWTGICATKASTRPDGELILVFSILSSMMDNLCIIFDTHSTKPTGWVILAMKQFCKIVSYRENSAILSELARFPLYLEIHLCRGQTRLYDASRVVSTTAHVRCWTNQGCWSWCGANEKDQVITVWLTRDCYPLRWRQWPVLEFVIDGSLDVRPAKMIQGYCSRVMIVKPSQGCNLIQSSWARGVRSRDCRGWQ